MFAAGQPLQHNIILPAPHDSFGQDDDDDNVGDGIYFLKKKAFKRELRGKK